MEKIQRQLDIQAVAWAMLVVFSQVYSVNCRQKVEQKNLGKKQFLPRWNNVKVGAKGSIVGENIYAIKKKSSMLYRDKKKHALKASQKPERVYSLQLEGYKTINILFKKRVLGTPTQERN